MPTSHHPIAQHPHGDLGFAVYGTATTDPPCEFAKPGYFQELAKVTHDGDILVVNFLPFGSRGRAPGAGRTYVFVIHHDAAGEISLTKLFELPHERDLVRAMARRLRGLFAAALAPEEGEEGEAEDPVLAGRTPPSAPDEIPTAGEARRAREALIRAQQRERERAKTAEQAKAFAALEREATAAAEAAACDSAQEGQATTVERSNPAQASPVEPAATRAKLRLKRS